MKLLVLFALAFVAAADEVEVISDLRTAPEGPAYNYAFKLANGIEVEETGSEGSAGQAVAQGSYRFVSPENEEVYVSYSANEGGFQPESAHLPQPHALPAHAIELIQIAAEQRASGVEWNEQGFEI